MEKKKKHGGNRQGAGRKSKSDEQSLVDKLSPFEEEALEALKKGVKQNQSWAIKLYFEYMYGKPHQTIDQSNTHSFEPIDMNEWE